MLDINRLKLSEKDKNQLQVLEEVFSHERISASDIVSKVGISAATISRVFRNLKEKELIKYLGKEKTEKGRSPELFSVNEAYGYMLHYHMTATEIKGYLLDITGRLEKECSVKYRPQGTLEDMLDVIQIIRDDLVVTNGQRELRLLAAGFSIPGVINQTARMIHKIPDIFLLSDTKFFDYAERILGVPIILNNVSRLATIGEKASVYPFIEDFVYFNVSESIGIGMGIIVGNRLVKGGRNYAGEIGQTRFNSEYSFEDYLNGKGHFEFEAGLQTLYSRIEKALQKGGCVTLKKIMAEDEEEAVSLESLEKAAMAGDEDVKEIFDTTLKAWASILINIDLIMNPEVIVLGGRISTENEYILGALQEFIPQDGMFKPEIRLSVLGENAQLIGGIQELKDYVFNNIIVQEVIS